MGLDMYLNRSTYIPNEVRRGMRITGVNGNQGVFGTLRIDASKVKYIVEQVAYWRKANAVHTVSRLKFARTHHGGFVVAPDDLVID